MSDWVKNNIEPLLLSNLVGSLGFKVCSLKYRVHTFFKARVLFPDCKLFVKLVLCLCFLTNA